MITGLILRSSEALIVIGRDMECVVRAKIKKAPCVPTTIIRNWSDHRKVYPVPEMKNPFVQEHDLAEKFVIQYSGRMGRTHNLEPLIEAARLIKDQEIVFQFIGDGAKREPLTALTESYHLNNVQFLPYQPFENLMNVLSAPQLAVVCLDNNCSGFSVPSKSYGIMAAGRPILGFLSPESEIGRMIEDIGCGIVIPEPTGQNVAKEIRGLIDDPDRVTQMGEKGYNAFIENYTLDMAVEKYSQFLSQYFPGARQIPE